MTDPIELTEWQEDMLHIYASTGESFLIFDPQESDTKEMQDKRSECYRDIDSLITLGLVEEITNKYPVAMKTGAEKLGKTFRAFSLTAIGATMFKSEDKEVN